MPTTTWSSRSARLRGFASRALGDEQLDLSRKEFDRAARSVAGGDLDVTVTVEGSTEQRSLARSLAAPPSAVPVVRSPPSGLSPSGGEQDHGGGGSGHADD